MELRHRGKRRRVGCRKRNLDIVSVIDVQPCVAERVSHGQMLEIGFSPTRHPIGRQGQRLFGRQPRLQSRSCGLVSL